MAATRKGNDKYVLGKDTLGRSAWLLRNPHHGSVKPGSAGNLLGVADQGALDPCDDLPVLPKPSAELTKRLLADGDWLGLDLSGLDLRDVLAECEVRSLSGTNLSGADLRGGLLVATRGDNVNLSGARTAGMTIGEGVQLYGVTTDGTFDLTDAELGRVNIGFANRTRLVGFRGAARSVRGGYGHSVRFVNVDFSGEHFDFNDLDVFSELSGSDFANTTFAGVPGNGFWFSALRFTKCSFTGADIPYAAMASVRFEDCDLSNANLSGWTFDGSNKFYDCRFDGSDLSGWADDRLAGWCDMQFAGSTSIVDANLTGVDGKVLSAMMRSGGNYKTFTVSEAATRMGTSIEEVGLLVWLGEVETRDNLTLRVAEGLADDSVHVPEWSLRNLT